MIFFLALTFILLVTALVSQAVERQGAADLLRRAGYDVTPSFIEDGLAFISC